ncbi:MAG: DNA polymerase I, partial [Deltaproteobacteria bacterium]|nr:DNA polymerase I [Deltaproteobacteria bacterium]
MSRRGTLYLVDGSGYIFRAYFAVRHLSTAAGQPTNAVFGVTNMLLKVLREQRPDHIAVAFDVGGPTFRHQMYAEYKANRPPLPEDLRPQIPLVHRAVEALAIPVVTLPGYEADDVLGTLARQAVTADFDVVILTGDKDLMQLVDDRVTLYDGLKDRRVARDEVIERFGVPPEQVVDVLALAGDSSDNVPGVRGIGEKTAAVLVQEHGDVEAILAAAPAIKQKGRREKLLADAELARLSRRLVTIDTAAPVTLDLDAIRYRGPDIAACRALFAELEFQRLLADPLFGGVTAGQQAGASEAQAAAPAGSPAGAAAAVVDRDRYRTILDAAALREVVERCRAAGRFAIDTETDGLDPMRARLVGVSLAWSDNQACYVPCGHQPRLAERQLALATAIECLAPLLADAAIAKVAQHGKFDRTVLLRHGLPPFEIGGDPMLASYLLDPGESTHGLDALALRHLGHRNIAYQEVCGKGREQIGFDQVALDAATRYSAEDADVTLRLEALLRPRLAAAKLEALYDGLELPLERVLCDMERCGVLVDSARLASMSGEMQRDLGQVEQQCHELAGHAFNLASPKQVAQVLFEELKLPVVKRTKSGPSTDAEVLEALQHQHALPARLLEHRLISKLRSTYVDVLPRLVHPETGRVHTQFNQAVAATGRLSSSDPNLQNIPVR